MCITSQGGTNYHIIVHIKLSTFYFSAKHHNYNLPIYTSKCNDKVEMELKTWSILCEKKEPNQNPKLQYPRCLCFIAPPIHNFTPTPTKVNHISSTQVEEA